MRSSIITILNWDTSKVQFWKRLNKNQALILPGLVLLSSDNSYFIKSTLR